MDVYIKLFLTGLISCFILYHIIVFSGDDSVDLFWLQGLSVFLFLVIYLFTIISFLLFVWMSL